MGDPISLAAGGSTYRCTRGNCNEPVDGPHVQDEHNHRKHLYTPGTLPSGAQQSGKFPLSKPRPGPETGYVPSNGPAVHNGMNESPDVPRFGADDNNTAAPAPKETSVPDAAKEFAGAQWASSMTDDSEAIASYFGKHSVQVKGGLK